VNAKIVDPTFVDGNSFTWRR